MTRGWCILFCPPKNCVFVFFLAQCLNQERPIWHHRWVGVVSIVEIIHFTAAQLPCKVPRMDSVLHLKNPDHHPNESKLSSKNMKRMGKYWQSWQLNMASEFSAVFRWPIVGAPFCNIHMNTWWFSIAVLVLPNSKTWQNMATHVKNMPKHSKNMARHGKTSQT